MENLTWSYMTSERYLALNTSEGAPPQRQPDRPVLDLPTPEGWKTESTMVLIIHQDGLPVRKQSPI